MGLFAACLPVIDIDPSTVDGYHVLLLAEEPKPVRAGMSVGVDNTAETQATFSAETRSASGRGESLSMQVCTPTVGNRSIVCVGNWWCAWH
jgi:hypothetical protein